MGWSYDKDYDYNNITIIWYQRDFTNKVVNTPNSKSFYFNILL